MSSSYAAERAQATRRLPVPRFDPTRHGLDRYFSDAPLEAAVMATLWQAERPLTVKGVWKRLDHHPVAYNTVMTTVNRLWGKAWLDRNKTGYCYTYTVRETQDAFEERMTETIRGSLGI